MKIVLDRLPIASGAYFDSHDEEHNPTCLPSTRVELLHEISEWAEDPSTKSVFWLNGMAGTGKSTISRTLAQQFATNGLLGASFFFKRGEAGRGNLSQFFTTIAADLVVREPTIAYHIKSVIDADPTIITKTRREQFEKLILQPLTATKRTRALVFVIDALDECERDEDIRLLVHLFTRAKSVPALRLKFFLTSRPELPIRLQFKLAEGAYQDLILHEIPNSIVGRDIRVFLEHELTKIRREYNVSVSKARQLPLNWPDQSNIQVLVEMAIPLFIFAATVCRFLADRKCGNPIEQLDEILQQSRNKSSQLDATYLPVLNSLLVGLDDEQRDKALQDFRDIVGPIVVLATPLPTSVLARVLDISQPTIEGRLDMLHSVLNVPSSEESPVRLLHLSFRDFLVDPRRRGKNPFWIDEQEAHRIMASNCLRILDCLKEDICGLGHPGTLRSTIDPKRVLHHLPPETQYACLYWVYHIEQAKLYFFDVERIYLFLIHHFLHWLEALSLMNKTSESLGYIQTLQSLFGVS